MSSRGYEDIRVFIKAVTQHLLLRDRFLLPAEMGEVPNTIMKFTSCNTDCSNTMTRLLTPENRLFTGL